MSYFLTRWYVCLLIYLLLLTLLHMCPFPLLCLPPPKSGRYPLAFTTPLSVSMSYVCARACMFFDYFLPVAPTPFPSEICQSVPCTRGDPPKLNLFIKMCVLILTCLNFSHLQIVVIWCNTAIETFFHWSKQFLNLSVLMPFSASAVFCFTSSTSTKCFLLRTFFFIQGNKKKLFGVRSGK